MTFLRFVSARATFSGLTLLQLRLPSAAVALILRILLAGLPSGNDTDGATRRLRVICTRFLVIVRRGPVMHLVARLQLPIGRAEGVLPIESLRPGLVRLDPVQ